MIRVLLADDEAMVRAGVRAILETDEAIEVVAEAADGRDAVEAAQRHRPDVALLDVRMPRMDGLAAGAEIARTAPETARVMLTTFSEDAYIARALGDRMSRAADARAKVAALTDRERDVMALVGAGLSNAEIGRRLHLVEGTVKAYLSSAFGRLGVRNRVQAAVLAHEAGLVSEDR